MPALSLEVYPRNCSTVHPFSVATCGSIVPEESPFLIYIPCFPRTISLILLIFFSGPSTVISISVFLNSAFDSGDKRGSSNAEEIADSCTTLNNGSEDMNLPMQPLKAPFIFNVTKAPIGFLRFEEIDLSSGKYFFSL